MRLAPPQILEILNQMYGLALPSDIEPVRLGATPAEARAYGFEDDLDGGLRLLAFDHQGHRVLIPYLHLELPGQTLEIPAIHNSLVYHQGQRLTPTQAWHDKVAALDQTQMEALEALAWQVGYRPTGRLLQLSSELYDLKRQLGLVGLLAVRVEGGYFWGVPGHHGNFTDYGFVARVLQAN